MHILPISSRALAIGASWSSQLTSFSPPFSPILMAPVSRNCSLPDGTSSDSVHHVLDHDHHDAPPMKRLRPTNRFAIVVKRALELEQQKKLCSAIEPLLRKAVSEEMERQLDRIGATTNRLRRSPSIRVQAPEPLPVDNSIHLVFTKPLQQPIFTLNKIVFDDGSPVQVGLVDPRSADPTTGLAPLVSQLTLPIKLEIVVLKGEFFPDGGLWTEEEFDSSILRAREGKRPLLTGDQLTAILRQEDGCLDHLAVSFADLQLTDNSKGTRSRTFRLGVRVVPGSYKGPLRIREAVTDPFIVRDHRGEAYKKHYPPKLEDDIWRVEKIARGGKLDKKLASEGIKTVRDLLVMSVFNPQRLQSLVGSKKNLETSLKHATTCDIGRKRYFYQAENCSLIFDSIYRLVGAHIGVKTYTDAELTSLFDKTYIDKLVQEAYANWVQVQEDEG